MTTKCGCNVIVRTGHLANVNETRLYSVTDEVLLCNVIEAVTLTFEPQTVRLLGYLKVIY